MRRHDWVIGFPAMAIALALAMFWAGAAESKTYKQQFLDMAVADQTTYLYGYIHAQLDLEAAIRKAGMIGIACGDLTIGEVADLMRMSIRRSKKNFVQARQDAFYAVCPMQGKR